MSHAPGSRLSVAAGRRRITRLVATYAEIPAGGAAMLFGSSDYLELAANQARADRLLGLSRGDSIHVRLSRA
jgi:S-adenosylmethionine hydrolase